MKKYFWLQAIILNITKPWTMIVEQHCSILLIIFMILVLFKNVLNSRYALLNSTSRPRAKHLDHFFPLLSQTIFLNRKSHIVHLQSKTFSLVWNTASIILLVKRFSFENKSLQKQQGLKISSWSKKIKIRIFILNRKLGNLDLDNFKDSYRSNFPWICYV